MKKIFAAAAFFAASLPCHAASLPHFPLHANTRMNGVSALHFSDQDELNGLPQTAPTIEAGILGFGMNVSCERCVDELSDRGAMPSMQLVAVAIHF